MIVEPLDGPHGAHLMGIGLGGERSLFRKYGDLSPDEILVSARFQGQFDLVVTFPHSHTHTASSNVIPLIRVRLGNRFTVTNQPYFNSNRALWRLFLYLLWWSRNTIEKPLVSVECRQARLTVFKACPVVQNEISLSRFLNLEDVHHSQVQK